MKKLMKQNKINRIFFKTKKHYLYKNYNLKKNIKNLIFNRKKKKKKIFYSL
jgi:hypothetical protein